jgi:hypothetical protein
LESGGYSRQTLSMASPMSASGFEAEGDPGEQADAGVDGLDEAVGEVVEQGGLDPGPVTVIDWASLTKAGMRQRRAHTSHASSSATARRPLSLNTSRAPP